jgi:D-arginine dehydrogenase
MNSVVRALAGLADRARRAHCVHYECFSHFLISLLAPSILDHLHGAGRCAAAAFSCNVFGVNLDCDIAVIGGGMAGASVAAHLAEFARVSLLEMEGQPGYHSTGRSAALFSETYGNDAIRALTRASRDFFYSPPPSFCNVPLVQPRSVLFAARGGQGESLRAFLQSEDSGRLVRKSADEAVELCPVLKRDGLLGAALDTYSADIEVHELHQGYLRILKSRGGAVRTSAEVTSLERDGDSWRVTTEQGRLRAGLIVNAAGAWAGRIAALAGAQPVGLQPLRRTACLLDAPPGSDSDSWPMLLDIDEQFYLKPDAGKLLLSPADETPSDPCDAQPDEMDLAVAVDRLEAATTLNVRRIVRKWAGLRSFVADRTPVVGYDVKQSTFFWLAALGGYGIQTAPALSRLAASLVLNRPLDEQLRGFGVDTRELSPARITSGAGS